MVSFLIIFCFHSSLLTDCATAVVKEQLEENPSIFVVHKKATLGHTPYPTGHDARTDCIWVASEAHWLLLHESLGKATELATPTSPILFSVCRVRCEDIGRMKIREAIFIIKTT